jgi:hypothetical protein
VLTTVAQRGLLFLFDLRLPVAQEQTIPANEFKVKFMKFLTQSIVISLLVAKHTTRLESDNRKVDQLVAAVPVRY